MATSGKRMRLGDILLEAGVITEDQLNQGLARQQQSREPLGEVLIHLGFVSQEQIKHALELQYGVKSISLRGKVPLELARLLPDSLIRQHKILPVAISQMTVAMVDPGNVLALDDLRLRFKGLSIQPVVITEGEFLEVLKSLPRESLPPAEAAEGRADNEPVSEAPVGEEQTASQLAHAILNAALRRKATEIILDPQEFETWLRMRIDGTLVKEPSIPNRLASTLVARFKVMAELTLTAGNVPQMGTIKMRHDGRPVTVTLRSLPVRHGQLLTLRLFDQGLLESVSLGSIVHHPHVLQSLRKLLEGSHGLILLNGPQHSGKSTLLYAMLREALSANHSIISFDQLPFDLEGIAQVPVDPLHPLATFEQILEQAPDFIAMPSLTDPDLARQLVHGALGGHLAVVEVPTIQRFLYQMQDLTELPARTLANAIAGVVTMRLVRRLCNKCKVPYRLDGKAAEFFRSYSDSGVLYRAVGCPECSDTGYSGQVGIYGVLPFDSAIRQMVASDRPLVEIDLHAKQQGHLLLDEYAAWITAQGFTTLEELSKANLFETEATV